MNSDQSGNNILEIYRNSLKSMQRFESETRLLMAEIEDLRESISSMEVRHVRLEKDMQARLSSQANDELSKLISHEQQKWSKEANTAQLALNDLEKTFNENLNRVSTDIKNQTPSKYATLLNKCESLLKNGSDILKSVDKSLINSSRENAILAIKSTSKITFSELEVAYYDTELSLSHIPEQEQGKFYRVLSKILQSGELKDDVKSNAVKFVVLLALLLIVIKETVLFIGLYTTFVIYCLITDLTNGVKTIKAITPLLVLDLKCSLFKTQLEDIMQVAVDKNKESLKQQYDNKKQELKAILDDAYKNYRNCEQRIRSTTTSETLIFNAKSTYEARIRESLDEIEELKQQLDDNNICVESNKNRLRQLIKDKEQYKIDLYERYLRPSQPGVSTLLIDSFFLGMTDTEELIEFKYDGKPTMVMYYGEDNTANEQLISMMIIQLLASMRITSIRIGIYDSFRACTPYAVFSPRELDGYIDLITTSENLKDYIQSEYDLLRVRSRDILSTSSNIEEYNKTMLARGSLTVDYHILLIQDPDDNLIKDPKFLQLCRTGFTVGIIPIIFLSNAQIMETIRGDSEKKKLFNEFLDVFQDRLYTYESKTQDLTHRGVTLKQQILNKMR